jgi:hypothetical protein
VVGYEKSVEPTKVGSGDGHRTQPSPRL